MAGLNGTSGGMTRLGSLRTIGSVEEAIRREAEAANAANPEIIRVVIADDHTLVREGIHQLLSADTGVTVVGEAGNGIDALRLIEGLAPDVALVDITMPGLNGIEVTRRARISRPEVAVLILTVHDEDPYVMALIEAGAAGYLLKTIEGRELVAAIRAVHSGQGALHPLAAQAVFAHVRSHPEREETPGLTGREAEILRLVAQGLSNKQIARSLDLSARTVQSHLAKVFRKLGTASRTEAVTAALRSGLLDVAELA